MNALYRLSEVGVRVPRPYNFIDGVLLMELVADAVKHAAIADGVTRARA